MTHVKEVVEEIDRNDILICTAVNFANQIKQIYEFSVWKGRGKLNIKKNFCDSSWKLRKDIQIVLHTKNKEKLF